MTDAFHVISAEPFEFERAAVAELGNQRVASRHAYAREVMVPVAAEPSSDIVCHAVWGRCQIRIAVVVALLVVTLLRGIGDVGCHCCSLLWDKSTVCSRCFRGWRGRAFVRVCQRPFRTPFFQCYSAASRMPTTAAITPAAFKKRCRSKRGLSRSSLSAR